eukprot:3203010-Pyramimonas_sp.AAC.1
MLSLPLRLDRFLRVFGAYRHRRDTVVQRLRCAPTFGHNPEPVASKDRAALSGERKFGEGREL